MSNTNQELLDLVLSYHADNSEPCFYYGKESAKAPFTDSELADFERRYEILEGEDRVKRTQGTVEVHVRAGNSREIRHVAPRVLNTKETRNEQNTNGE